MNIVEGYVVNPEPLVFDFFAKLRWRACPARRPAMSSSVDEVPTAEEIASFVDERGVGIHDMQWHLGEQQFRVGRLSVPGYSRINWIATAALTPAERRTAKQFRVARDHQLV